MESLPDDELLRVEKQAYGRGGDYYAINDFVVFLAGVAYRRWGYPKDPEIVRLSRELLTRMVRGGHV